MQVMLAVLLMLLATPAAATTYVEGQEPINLEFTYFLSPTSHDPGPDSASMFSIAPPDGPHAPGGATWSIMPEGTPSVSVEEAAYDTEHLQIVGNIPCGPFPPAYIPLVSDALDQWSEASFGGFTNLGQVVDTGAIHNALEPFVGSNTIGGDIRVCLIDWRSGAIGILAHGYQPGGGQDGSTFPPQDPPLKSILGDTHINSLYSWCDFVTDPTCDPDEQFDIGTVILHELGHNLGLGHSSNPGNENCVMWPGVGTGAVRRTFCQDELDGIRAIYTPPDVDNDGIDNEQDNCLVVPNPSQYDCDGDGYGNACDWDFSQTTAVGIADITAPSMAFNTADDCIDTDEPPDGIVGISDVNRVISHYGIHEGEDDYVSGLDCADGTGATAPCP